MCTQVAMVMRAQGSGGGQDGRYDGLIDRQPGRQTVAERMNVLRFSLIVLFPQLANFYS